MEPPRRDATPALAKEALCPMTRSPRLLHVREPDQLRVERAHPQLAFGVRLVEPADPNRHVASAPGFLLQPMVRGQPRTRVLTSPHVSRWRVLPAVLELADRLNTALAGRYAIQRELGA